MKRILLAVLALFTIHASAATYAFSYAGLGDFAGTSGAGTFTTRGNAVTSITGTFTDEADTLYGLSPVPIIGLVPAGTLDHFTFDNELQASGPLLDNGGIVFEGLREASNGYFYDVVGYVNIYSDQYGYRVDTWLPDYAAGDFDVPVALTITLLPAVPEPSAVLLLLLGLGLVALASRRRTARD